MSEPKVRTTRTIKYSYTIPRSAYPNMSERDVIEHERKMELYEALEGVERDDFEVDTVEVEFLD